MARAVDVISLAMKGRPKPPVPQDEDEDSNVEFPIPEGFKIPSTAKKDGDEFTAIATLQLSDNATTLTLTKVDGMPIGAGESDEEEAGEQGNEAGDKNVASMIKEGVAGRGEGY
jgi:hypothetical protein